MFLVSVTLLGHLTILYYAALLQWILSVNIAKSKTLDSSDNSYSTHLYHYTHFLYTYSLGEASLVEIIAIIGLNFYLYYSSIYTETLQLMEQVWAPLTSLACIFGAPRLISRTVLTALHLLAERRSHCHFASLSLALCELP